MAAENDLERLERLDACQLDFMYSMIRLRKGGAVKKDVRDLISYLDDIRQARRSAGAILSSTAFVLTARTAQKISRKPNGMRITYSAWKRRQHEQTQTRL